MSEGGDVFELGRKEIYWILAGFVIAVLMLAFVIIVGGYQGRLMAVPSGIKAQFVTLRFFTNPDCFAYQDPITKRVFPYTIDLSKFTEKQMTGCYQTDKEKGYRDFNFKVTIDYGGMSVQTNNYYQVSQFSQEYAVLIWDGKHFIPSTVTVDVQETLSYIPGDKQNQQLSNQQLTEKVNQQATRNLIKARTKG